MNILCDSIRRDGEFAGLLSSVLKTFGRENRLPIVASGLCSGASDALCAALIEDVREERGGVALMVCPEEKEAVAMRNLLTQFGLKCGFFIARDLTFYNITASHEYEHERLNVLYGIQSGEFDVVITTPDAALGYTVPPEVLSANSMRIDYKRLLNLDETVKKLVDAGYIRVDRVDCAGQFAVRGGILDIFPPYGRYVDSDGNEKNSVSPLRIELFGDDIDRMGIFETDSQRITDNIDYAELPPARELIITPEAREKLKKAIKSHLKQSNDGRAREEMQLELEALENGLEVNFADKYISLIYPQRVSLLDYLGEDNLVIIRGTAAVNERLKTSEWTLHRQIEELMEGGTISSKYVDFTKPASAFESFCDKNVALHAGSMTTGLSGKKLGGLFGFRTKHTVSYAENLELLREDLATYAKNDYRTIVLCENEAAANSLCELLSNEEYQVFKSTEEEEFSSSTQPKGTVQLIWRSYIGGYELPAAKIAILSTYGAGKSASLRTAGGKKRGKKIAGTQKILSYAELKVGDYVVHEDYGIGIYLGISNKVINGISRDYISIQYAGADKLFLPTEKLDKVSKYIGAHADDGSVKLSKFGGAEWGKAKSKVKGAVKEMAKELIQLYASRLRLSGIAFPPDDDFQRDFEAAFDYDETNSQIVAIEEIKQDMMSTVPMDRLLCGDVGFGKTEVAFRAAYKAILGGKQVAILVPTTILAMQHYQTALARFRSFPVEVDIISRFRTPKQQALTLRRLKRGEIDMIIGTHRLVSKDIEFKDLGLLIIDEEQRFGVAQKEKLKQLCGNVDVLTLSATPIPRTLNMAMGGLRDISILDEAPSDRLPVQTYVLEHDDLIIEEAIRRELRRGGQVFYLHNNIDNINVVAARLSAAIPDARITVAHGRMEKEELEEIWGRMLSGETDILVSTTIIETGVDVPNANTLIVENAHRLGLSQLHQLRGRVGRSSRRAYAYFTFPRGRALDEIAEKRLEAVREYAEFGAGFKIALRDMELRGAGNLLGAEQHGHLEAIGYDLYIKLLNEAVLEEKGGKIEPKPDCNIALNLDAYLPERYVGSSAERMALYKKIAMIDNKYDMEDITDELFDRFGNPPKAAMNLLQIALIRAYAIKCGITRVEQTESEIHIFPTSFDWDIWSDLSKKYGGRIKIVMSGSPYMNLRLQKDDKPGQITEALLFDYIQMNEAKKENETNEE